MNELWTLMNIVDHDKFNDLAAFMEQYGNMKSKEKVDNLHESIRPYILRRLKEDVEKSVPPKEETLIEVELTVMQKKYYRALYEKNVQFLHRNVKKALDGPSLNNLAMQLRKCCNHPFLLTGVEEDAKKEAGGDKSTLSFEAEADLLVKSSGKLVLLEKLLPRLKEGGHRVLIFSQFKIMLDILEDFLNVRNFRHERIDGSITGKKRQMAIDRFQVKESIESSFIMLLSTRAGGVGINLTAADTCIIFDSDWNPQNDLQAQARCHRIGQTKSVKIYRLLSRKTYEMQMFHMSSMKMGLDKAVLQGIESGASGGPEGENILTKEEVEKLLRHGAYDIFNEEKNESSEKESTAFIEQDLDSILARRSKTVVHENTGSQSNAAGGAFSKASFKSNTNGPNSNEKVDIDDPDFWKKMVGETKLEKSNEIDGKKRKRKSRNYDERQYDKNWRNILLVDAKDNLSDYDSEDGSSADENEFSDDDNIDSPHVEFDLSSKENFKNTDLQRIFDLRRNAERFTWGGKAQKSWKKKDVITLVKIILPRYGYGDTDWNVSCSSFKKLATKEYDDNEVKRMCWALSFVALQEAVDDDVCDTMKRIKRKARKEQEVKENATTGSNEKKKNKDVNCGVFSDDWKQKQYKSSFQKIWSSHSMWATAALEDALSFSSVSDARCPKTLSSKKDESEEKSSAGGSTLINGFMENIWPALTSRGWKIEKSLDRRKAKNKSTFSRNGKEFFSVAEVLDAIPGIHPELTNIAENIILVVSTHLEPEKKKTSSVKSSLDLSNVDFNTLRDFLDQYAPLQLIFDRRGPKQISLSSKLLDILSYLRNANSLLESAKIDKMSGSISSFDYRRLAELISVNTRASLPHPMWEPAHDAALILAIAKHGWIERDCHCQAITEDKTIMWGRPFDKKSDSNDSCETTTTTSTKEENFDYDEIKSVAKRVVNFLNGMHSQIVDSDVFNWNLVLKSFGIIRHVSNDENDIKRWEFDHNSLKSQTHGKCESDEDKISDNDSLVDLPTKKDLLKRSKTILSKISLLPRPPQSTNQQKTNNQFGVLDQGNRANIFLAELLRLFIKTSRRKGNLSLKKLGEIARREAEYRFQRTAKKKSGDNTCTEALTLRNIANSIAMVLRHTQKLSSIQAKNVFRAILGIDPINPKKFGDPVFLVESYRPFPTVCTGNSACNEENESSKKIHSRSLGQKRVQKKESAAGDAALNRALCNVKRKGNRNDKAEADIGLRLTFTESLILSVLCSQGIPIYSDRLSNLYTDDGNVRNEYAITWIALGSVLEIAAKEWYQFSERKLSLASLGDGSSDTKDLKDEVEGKKEAFIESMRLHQSPDRLAKKSIMLLEAIRRRMGQADGPKRKADQGLGGRCLNWNSKHLNDWARSLVIMQNGRSLAMTGQDYITDESIFGSAAYVEKKECRAIFIQIAQQTRLRSIFMKYNSKNISKMLSKAVKSTVISGDVWDAQPPWWGMGEGMKAEHDQILLSGMLKYGFGGFEAMMEQTEMFRPLMNHYIIGDSKPFTRKSVQQRVNQITRELNAIDESADNVRLLEERRKRLNNQRADPLKPNNALTQSTNSPSIQMGINAFLQPSKGKEVILLSDSEGSASPKTDVKRKSDHQSVSSSPKKKLKN